MSDGFRAIELRVFDPEERSIIQAGEFTEDTMASHPRLTGALRALTREGFVAPSAADDSLPPFMSRLSRHLRRGQRHVFRRDGSVNSVEVRWVGAATDGDQFALAVAAGLREAGLTATVEAPCAPDTGRVSGLLVGSRFLAVMLSPTGAAVGPLDRGNAHTDSQSIRITRAASDSDSGKTSFQLVAALTAARLATDLAGARKCVWSGGLVSLFPEYDVSREEQYYGVGLDEANTMAEVVRVAGAQHDASWMVSMRRSITDRVLGEALVTRVPALARDIRIASRLTRLAALSCGELRDPVTGVVHHRSSPAPGAINATTFLAWAPAAWGDAVVEFDTRNGYFTVYLTAARGGMSARDEMPRVLLVADPNALESSYGVTAIKLAILHSGIILRHLLATTSTTTEVVPFVEPINGKELIERLQLPRRSIPAALVRLEGL